MKRGVRFGLVAALLALGVVRESEAQDKTPAAKAPAAKAPAAAKSAERAEDEKAIREAAQQFVAAFQSGDEKRLAALFTEDAEYLDEGSEPIHGREALVKAYQGLFSKRAELKAEAQTDAVRFLGKDTAVEEGTFTVTAEDSPSNASRYSALYVREDGVWRVALMKEWQDAGTRQPDLSDLEWLVGTWEGVGPEMTARTTYAWTANKAFIRADYTITHNKTGEKSASGTQVIGVDPAVGQIRGWLFSSDGGIGESTWVWDGERWMVESVGTLADGQASSALNLMTRSGDDSFTARSVQRRHAGESLPDAPAVTVKRVAKAAEGTTSK